MVRVGLAIVVLALATAAPAFAHTFTGADASGASVSVAITGPAAPVVGDAVTYTYTATNNGPDPAADLAISISTGGSAFSGGSIGVSTGGTCKSASGTYSWTCSFGTVAAGATASVTFSSTSVSSTPTTLNGQATTSAADPDLSDNTASLSVTATKPTADLSLTNSAPSTADTGTQVKWDYTVKNPSNHAVVGVTVSGIISPNFGQVFATMPGNYASCFGNTCTIFFNSTVVGSCTSPTSLGPNSFSCTIQKIDALSSALIHVGATAIASGTATTSAHLDAPQVDDPTLADHDTTATTSLRKTVDLAVQNTGPSTVTAGQAFEYPITIANPTGPEDATGVTATLTLPTGVSLVSAPAGCTGTRTLSCSIGAIAKGAVGVVTPTLIASATGTYSFSIAETSTEPDRNAADDSLTAVTQAVTQTVEPGAHLTTTVTGPAAPLAGDTVTYTYTVENAGPDPATDLVLSFSTGGASFAGGASITGGGACQGGTAPYAWACSFGTLPAGSSATMTFTSVAVKSGPVTLAAAATTSATDPDVSDNTATLAVSIGKPTADVSLTADAPATANVGDSVDWKYTVHNPSTHALAGVVVTGSFAPQYTRVGVRLPGADNTYCYSATCIYSFRSVEIGYCLSPAPSGPGTFFCSIDTVAPGSTFSVFASGTASTGGVAVSSAHLDASQVDDPTADDHDAAATTTISGAPELVVSSTSGLPAHAGAGDTVPFDVTVQNTGTGASAAAPVRVYLSADATLDSSDLRLYDGSVSGLAVGQSADVSGTLTLPDGIAAGDDHLLVVVADGNPAAVPFTVYRPDLAVSDASALPADGRIGDTVHGSFTVANLGLATVHAASVPVALYLSSGAGDVKVVSTAVAGPLAPGATVSSGDVSFVVPEVAPGSYRLRVVADDGDTVAESDETNNASGVSFTVRPKDDTPPTTTATASPAANAAGWNAGPVTVHLAATDEPGGSGVAGIEWSTGTATGTSSDVTVADEGVTALRFRATDVAGNVEPWQTLAIRIDSTAPTTTATPSATGWSRGPVAVDLAAADGGSGVAGLEWSTGGASGTTSHVTIADEGVTTLRFRATDVAGNVEPWQTLTIQIDATPPSVTCGSADGTWHAANVSVGCTASDGGSGLTSPASFALATAVADGSETADAATATQQVCDVAGNCVTAGPIGGNRVDRKAPVITLSTPDDVPLRASARLTYGCTDGGSGVATCSGPVASGGALDTSTPGAHTVTITATDAVGNTATLVRTYVVRFARVTLLAPLDGADPHAVKAGQTVPVKLGVYDALGAAVVAPGTITDFTQVGGGSPVSTNGATAFRLADDGSWIFNLSTRDLAVGSTYTYRIGLADGTAVTFQLAVR